MELDQREVILVVGQTGTGKTTWAKNYIKTLTRVVVADAGFSEYGVKEASDFEDLTREIQKKFFRISYGTQYWEWPYLFEACRISGEKDGSIYLVLEEAYRAGNTRDVYEYNEAVNMGRHWGLSLIALSTRAAKLPTDYKAQVTRIVAFRQVLPNDIEYLRDIVGETAYLVPDLKNFEYIEWTPDGKFFKKKLGSEAHETIQSENGRVPSPMATGGGGDHGEGVAEPSPERVPGTPSGDLS